MSKNIDNTAIEELKDIFWVHREALVTDDFLQKLEEKSGEVFDLFVRLSVKYYWGILKMPLPELGNENEKECLQKSFYMMQFLLMDSIMQSVGKWQGEKQFKAMEVFWKHVSDSEKQALVGNLSVKLLDSSGTNISPTIKWETVLKFLYQVRNNEHHNIEKRILGLFRISRGNAAFFSVEGKSGNTYTCLSKLEFKEFQKIFERNFLTHFINYVNEK